ncbi:restriction endonuclease subunit S [Hydrogenophaga sp. XSHU_21]
MTVWRKARLGDCCEIVSGATPSTAVDDYWDGDTCWATPRDLSGLDGHYISDTPRKLTEAGLASCSATILPPNSVLFSSRAPIGHVAINTVPMATNQGFKSLVPGPEVDAKFLLHWLRANRSFLEGLGVGATFKEVSKAVVTKVEIPLPPLAEQRRIAAILDRADALRATSREALAQIDRLAQSIFVEMFGDPVSNSKGWNLAPLPDATDFQEGPGILAKDFREEGIPLVRLAGMGGAEVSLRGCNFVDPAMFARKWSHFALEEGDILVLTSATFGSPTVVGKDAVGALFYTGIIRFRPKGHDLDSTYLRHYLASPWFLRQATALASGAVIKHFGPTHLRQMTIPVPPLQLQQQFAMRIAAQESLRIQAKEAAAMMEQLFASVQQQAFSGGL